MPHLSSAIRTGSLLFLSGQLAFDDKGRISGDIEAQTALTLKHQFAVLAQHGLSPENVVKVGVWLTDRANFQRFDQTFARVFGAHRPTRSTVISQLALEGALVEIDLIASFEPLDS
ncbi:Enamine deaminase RidA, house cleaning of reactive enamine intermediates, YjgF/YER057c/UK114 family [Malonomonas rubra DSM 5091]|uniref:Enamine deaminase RidA, house cleaning of reactive enamine intermediates, YjgF/YER057c/UK114 family n=1 Tax=Malonomonas rubra DSM 5091 TaxID=1122189 RepID=A0A1M6N720_MALRU|nr:RidA family protein [Malonomonas rubra]SHJ91346.1 Enamine deaminase RidA, house cleaning of reactive enamine intermediates, YjgF/YER057c/UK114 family [Malonomonas rubra DSM 5091]